MSLLYIIQCHSGFHQICILIENLNLGDSDIVIVHVDSKKDELKKLLLKKYSIINNVYIINNTSSVNWSGFSQVKATLCGFEFAKKLRVNFDFVVLLSGECTPVKSTNMLKKYLEEKQVSFLDFKKRPDYNWRINRYVPFRENKYNRTFFLKALTKLIVKAQCLFPVRKNFTENQIFSGSQWFVLKRAHFEEIVTYLKNNKYFLNKFMLTSCADEYFFQILFNTIGISDFESKNLHFIRFCENESSPDYLAINDLYKASNLENVFFARKIDAETAIKFKFGG